MNQCDGCARRLPLINGIHKGSGYDYIACTKARYTEPVNAQQVALDRLIKTYPQPKDWPEPERIEIIASNGNNGDHYEAIENDVLPKV